MRKASIPICAAIACASGVAAQTPERFSLAGDAAIFNLAGDVVIEADTAANTVVELTRGGADAERLVIEVGEVDGWQTLQVRYPAKRIVYPRLGGASRIEMRVGRDGRFGTTWSGRAPGGPSLGAVLGLLGLGSGRRISIRGGGSGLEAYADLRILVPAGHTVAIHVGAGSARAANVHGRLFVQTQTGDIESDGHHGELHLRSGTGDITAVGGRGDLHLDVGTGDIVADDYTGHVFDIGIGLGSITLSSVTANAISIDTKSGNVAVELLTLSPSLGIDTGSGSVTLSVPPDLSASLDLETGSGGIDVDLPLRVERRNRNELRATVGTGAGSIRVETRSGGIHIKNASIR